MKFARLALLILLLSISGILVSQKKDKSVELYDLGNIAFAKKDYKTADSLFTLSLNLGPHPDTYFNRAACRKKLNDFKGYCIDLGSASNMNDAEAKKIFWTDCAKTDTIFSKNGDEFANINGFETVEFITTYKYNNTGEYEKYNSKGELLLSYELIDKNIIYINGKEVAAAYYQSGLDSMAYYFSTQNPKSIKKLKENNLYGRTFITLTIDETGNIADAKVLSDDTYGITNSALECIKKLKGWAPALYANKAVKFRITYGVQFAYGKIRFVIIEPKRKYKARLNKTKSQSTGEVFTQVETMPEYPGGTQEMMKFIQSNLKIPPIALNGNVKGKCFIKFVVTDIGEITDVEVLQSTPGCFECDDEAVRVIKSMPKWKPGTQNGRPVSVYFNLPINFRIQH